jgi:hypothetical protein
MTRGLWDRADGGVVTADTDTTLRLLPDRSQLRLRYVATMTVGW